LSVSSSPGALPAPSGAAGATTPAASAKHGSADHTSVELGRWQSALASIFARPYLLLTVVLAAVMAPAWVTASALVVGGDVLLIHYPWFVLWRDALAAGTFPLWNPYTFSGIPAFATLQAGYGYPPHWLLTPLPAMLAINWLVALHVILAGLGAAWCAGRLGATREGQVLAGLTYALGSAMVARMWAGHLSFLEANAWLPLATGLAIDIRARRRVLLLAVVVALMTLAGQPEVVIFALWWLPLWAAGAALKAGPHAVVPAVGRIVLAMALGGGLAAFQMLPVLDVLAISNRQTRMDWDFRTAASLPPWHLMGMFAPLTFGDPRADYWPGPLYEWHERLLYVGTVPLLAAAFVGRRWRLLCWGAVAVAVALAFGGYAPWYPLAEWLPGYTSLRIPSKHLTLAALGLAIAAGVGLERLRGGRVAAAALGLAVLVAGAAWTIALWVQPVADWSGGADLLSGSSRRLLAAGPGPGLAASLLMLVLAALALGIRGAQPRRAALVALAAVELIVVLQPFRRQWADPAEIVARGASLQAYERAAILGEAGPVLGNYGPVLRVQQPGGYVSLFSGEYMTLVTGRSNAKVQIDIERDAVPILYLLGYSAVIERRGSRETVLPLSPPRAWVAHCSWPGGARQVRAPDFPRQSCITRAGTTAPDAIVDPGPARIVAEGAGWLTVDAEGPGWLVTTQPWYPGWSAEADGRPLAVEAVDGALVGVSLPPAAHRVTVRYWPGGLTRGLLVTGLAVLVLAGLWWLGRSIRPGRSAWHSLASF